MEDQDFFGQLKWRLFGPCLVIEGFTVICGSDGELGG